MMNEIFSFLPGYEIVHKIQLLSTWVRRILKNSLVPFANQRKIPLKVTGTFALHCFGCSGLFEDENFEAYESLIELSNLIQLKVKDLNFQKAMRVI